MKRNWTQEQPMASLLVIKKNIKGINFIVLAIVQELLELEILGS